MIRLVIASLFLYPVLGQPISGGHICDIMVHPWLASIQANGYHNCGGSIISRDLILTAAHCVQAPVEAFTIRVGSSRTDSGGQWHSVVAKKQHERYRKHLGSSVNDIALIKVSPRFNFTRSIDKIQLAEEGSTVSPGTLVGIAGWGTESHAGPTTYRLRSTNLLIIDSRDCSEAYGRNSGQGSTSNGQICAALDNNDACDGDSGSPLVHALTQIGIVSNGVGCGDPRYPGVYVDVATYRSWIDTHSKILAAMP